MRQSREERALGQLLRVANLRADEQRAQLAQLDDARRGAENAIEWLNKAVAAEERGLAASPEAIGQFQRYLDGAELKRRALASTRDRLACEIEQMRTVVSEAAVEIKKLEHLLSLRAEAAAKLRLKSEGVLADEAALLSRARK